jgi:hypothetical protein
MNIGKLIALLIFFIVCAVVSFFLLYYLLFKWLSLWFFDHGDLFAHYEKHSIWEALLIGWHIAISLYLANWICKKSFKEELPKE